MCIFFKRKKTGDPRPAAVGSDWDSGFRAGYPLWQRGEEQRKAGRYEAALALYDQARKNGYVSPALYQSYAMTFRKLNRRDAEAAILTEGIQRLRELNGKIGSFDADIRDLTEQLRRASGA